MFLKKLTRLIVVWVFLTSSALVWAFANTISLANLPPQAQSTYTRIQQGGPFPYEKDGVVFGNYEARLPQHPRGYYREYTVKTSAKKNRGAVRIVCGGLRNKPIEACYYTDDHYASFKKIVP